SSLSVTEIETWIRDPYAIYARHILRLRPMPPLGREADPLLRGSLYHRILERFVADRQSSLGLDRLLAIAREEFAAQGIPAEITAQWWPRFVDIARNFVDWESERSSL